MTVYVVPHELTSPQFARAFAMGLGKTGDNDRVQVLMPESPLPAEGPIAMFGSPALWPRLAEAKATGRTFYYGDHGYFGRKTPGESRNAYYRITRNALQLHDWRGRPNNPQRSSGLKMRDWRPVGKQRDQHVLVCPQSATFFRLHGVDKDAWLSETITTIRTHTNRSVRVREKADRRPITQDLATAWAVVVWSSACAIDALLAGVPVFVLNPDCASYSMGCPNLSAIETPYYPADRYGVPRHARGQPVDARRNREGNRMDAATSLTVFIGEDPREGDAIAVANATLKRHARSRVAERFVSLTTLGDRYTRPTEWRVRDGQTGTHLWDTISDAPMSTEHAIARFFVPELMKWRGWALFVDGDVLFRDDVTKLFALADPQYAVQVVQHAYQPKETTKMDGQVQLAYHRKNWSSVILWNCGHPLHMGLKAKGSSDPLNELAGRDLHRFCWLPDEVIGALPPCWNYLVGVSEPQASVKLAHFTLGTPDMPGYEHQEFANEWRAALGGTRSLAS